MCIKVLVGGEYEKYLCFREQRETNRDCAEPETEAPYRDLVGNPLPAEHSEKENRVKVRQTHLPPSSLPHRPVINVLAQGVCNSAANATLPLHHHSHTFISTS